MINKKIFNSVCIFLLTFAIVIQPLIVFAAGVKITYDGKTVNYTGDTYKITIDDKTVKTDLPGLVMNNNVMVPLRAFFESFGGTVIWNSKTEIMNITFKGNKIQFKNNSDTATLNGKNFKMASPAKKVNDRLIIPVSFMDNFAEFGYYVDKTNKVVSFFTVGNIKSTQLVTAENEDILKINAVYHKGITTVRQTNPDRIVIDIANVKGPKKAETLKQTSNMVKSIKLSSLNSTTARIEVELTGFHNYSIENQDNGTFEVHISSNPFTKMSYRNNQDRVFFALPGVKLTSGTTEITNYFTEQYDEENNKYIMTVTSGTAINVSDGVLNINDNYLSTVEVNTVEETGDRNIVFSYKNKPVFLTLYNDKTGETEINVLQPAKEDEQIVVIDAGHGGLDPGAVYKNVNEKDINLGIALKLEKLLKDKKVKTFMLRQDDTYVGLYDRPYIANALNASLFLSIHNNSFDNTSITGTETYYFPEKSGDTSFTGQKFGLLMHNSLISNLKTTDRKARTSTGLVVLKYTKMPSSLVEIGFLTNTKDRNNLVNEAFQQKTAQALCDGIMQALEAQKQQMTVNPK